MASNIPTEPNPSTPQAVGAGLTTVTGVQLMQGLGVQPAKGFWADAWQSVMTRSRARVAMIWLGLIALISILAPFIANGHPLFYTLTAADGSTQQSFPLFLNLKPSDVLLAVGFIASVAYWITARKYSRGMRLATILVVGLGGMLMVAASAGIFAYLRSADGFTIARDGVQTSIVVALRGEGGLFLRFGFAFLACIIPAVLLYFVLPQTKAIVRIVLAAATLATCSSVSAGLWERPLQNYDYREQIAAGKATAVFTLIPFSPNQRDVRGSIVPPGTSLGQTRNTPVEEPPIPGKPIYVLGTDSNGQDVLSQMLHACRLSISIGLISTGIAVMIGVTMGALMGYFGGWVDLLLYRVVEIFMALPVLFLLIVAAAVLPKSTYVMMVVIGCVSWTGAARFTRAEFMRLRNMDFVQAAKSVGLPLHSILFRHMLPNGVTPVLVDSSFAIASAILAEATLSYLGLGPEDQASWGKLLSDSTGNVGTILWWLAIFPGLAIFLTVLSYNLLGESLRDAIDPKLKKARV